MTIERWELVPSSKPDRYLLKARGDRTDLEKLAGRHRPFCQDPQEAGDAALPWVVVVTGASLNERLAIQDEIRAMVAPPPESEAVSVDLTGVLAELSLVLEELTGLTEEEQARAVKKVQEIKEREAKLPPMPAVPPSSPAAAPKSAAPAPPAAKPVPPPAPPPFPGYAPGPPAAKPEPPPAPPPFPGYAPGPPAAKPEPPSTPPAWPPTLKPAAKPEPPPVAKPPEPAAPPPAPVWPPQAPLTPPSPAEPAPDILRDVARAPAVPPKAPPSPSEGKPPAPSKGLPPPPLELPASPPPGGHAPVPVEPVPAGPEGQPPPDQVMKLAVFFPQGNEPAKDKFLSTLTEIAQKKARKPIQLQSTMSLATDINVTHSDEWVKAALSSTVECFFVILPPEILPDFMEKVVADARKCGIHCFLIPQAEIDSRLLYVDLMVELMLIKRKK